MVIGISGGSQGQEDEEHGSRKHFFFRGESLKKDPDGEDSPVCILHSLKMLLLL